MRHQDEFIILSMHYLYTYILHSKEQAIDFQNNYQIIIIFYI